MSMFQIFRNWLDQRVIRRSDITSAQWRKAFSLLPLLDPLTADEKHRLRELAILFMDRKSFEGAHGLVVSQWMALIIALQACLPILKLGLGSYDGWYYSPVRFISDYY